MALSTGNFFPAEQCVVCYEITTQKLPCPTCRDKDIYCCLSCAERSVRESSESCQTGLCFVCRDQQLDVRIDVRSQAYREYREYRPQNRKYECCICFIQFLLGLCICHVVGGTLRWLHCPQCHRYIYYLSGYPDDYSETVLVNLITGLAFCIFLYLVKTCFRGQNR